MKKSLKMKKLFLSLTALLVASVFVMAQTQKKVVIVKKTVTADGTEQVEKIVLEGEDAENFDINDHMPEKGTNQKVDIDVEIEETTTKTPKEPKKEIRIMKIEKSPSLDMDDIMDSGLLEKEIKVITGDDEDIRIIINGEEEMIINPNDLGNSEGEEIKIEMDGGEKKIIKIELHGDEGDKEGPHRKMIIIKSDGEDLLDDIDGILKDSGFEWNSEDGNHFVFQDDKNTPNKALLGVWPSDGDSDKGVLIGGVVQGSGAEKAGLEEGDVVTAIAGQPTKTFAELAAVIGVQKPGDQVQVEFLRDEAPKTVTATLGKQEERQFRFKMHKESKDMDNWKEHHFHKWSSATCCPNTKTEEKAYIGIMIEDGEKGVNIVEVNRGDDILRTGDVITKFGKQEVKDMDQLIAAVAPYKPGDKVKVRYLRNAKKGKGTVTLLGRKVKTCCSMGEKKEKTKTIRKEKIIIRTEEDMEAPAIKSDMGNARLELQDVELYPNPSDGMFQLKFKSGEEGAVTISISDATGKEIIRDEIGDFKGNYAGEFDLKGNTPGVYFLNISQNGKVMTEKIVLK
jgi:serine protease Do